MMKRYFAAAGALCVLTAVPAAAQTTAEHNKRTELSKGANVTIEGCVAAGQKRDTYVLGTVNEVVAVPVEMMRKRMYWLDSTKRIAGHVGHKVSIDGRVTDLERSEIEIDLGAGPNGGAVAKIEGPGGKEVSTATAKVGVGPVGTAGQLDADVPITLVKIKVNKVTRIAGSCS
jgi:hypothetical protein